MVCVGRWGLIIRRIEGAAGGSGLYPKSTRQAPQLFKAEAVWSDTSEFCEFGLEVEGERISVRLTQERDDSDSGQRREELESFCLRENCQGLGSSPDPDCA